MKLVRFGEAGAERPGVIDADGALRDAGGVAADWRGDALGDDALARVADAVESMPVVSGNPRNLRNLRLGAPVGGVGKLIVIGLNYREHAAEAGLPPPADPLVILASPTAVCGARDDLVLPPDSVKTDWEIELGVVIGADGKFIPPDRALDYVAGYVIVNDISERDYQLERGSQWGKGKSYDGFKPLGPWLVTRDEIPDPQNLNMQLRINGALSQNSNTADMIFPVAELISRVSSYMTLRAGDVFATGTPPGVGLGKQPPQFLKAGDELHLQIDGLGEQRTAVKSA